MQDYNADPGRAFIIVVLLIIFFIWFGGFGVSIKISSAPIALIADGGS